MKTFDVYNQFDVTPVKGKDVYVYDKENNRYLDLYGGHAVISIGHSEKNYVRNLTSQLKKIGFYSNAVKNPLQEKLSSEINRHAGLNYYKLFMCNSGAEAVENSLKLSSFLTGKKRIIAFKNSFHGRTSAAVAVTDNNEINSTLNRQHSVTFVDFNDESNLKKQLLKGDVCAIIFESIQGVGGLDQPSESFIKKLSYYQKKYKVMIIADEVQSGFYRSGNFFAYQKFDIVPDIITIAKGMGNGFPVGGILVSQKIDAKKGMLGTTYGGNHLACIASLSVLDYMEKNKIQGRISKLETYFKYLSSKDKYIKRVKGRGLMLGLEFDFNVSELRSKLVYEHRIFTGSSSNKNLIRILPPLSIKKHHFASFFEALKKSL
tara:strand:+ start:2487 stop:3611 length:1125 start_codon:yes stop_codon:yes gene_type:complete